MGAMLKKKNCRSLARGISHGDKFGNLIGTCGRVAADKSDNVWHWHQACEWAMLKKKKKFRSLARGISHGDKFGNLIKKLQKFGMGYFAWGQIRESHKKLQKFGTGYFARGQIREPHRYLRQGCSRQKRQCMPRGISHGDKYGNLKKKLQKFGTGYFARGQIREPQKKIAEVWHGVF